MSEGELKTHDELEAEAGRKTRDKRRHSRRMQEYLQQQDRSKTLPQKQRKCPYPNCGKLFSSNPGLRYHLATHSPSACHYRCERCRKEFKSHNGLKYHQTKTRCLDSLLDVPENPPSPPHAEDSLPLNFPSSQRDQDERSSEKRLSEEKDETDSMLVCDVPSQNLPESKHRKMESRRRRMQAAQASQAAESQQQPASLQLSRRPQPLESVDSGNQQRLLQFANIATGPQSPLLRKSSDWEWGRSSASEGALKSVAGDGVGTVPPSSVSSTITHFTATSLQVESDTKSLTSSSPLPSSPRESDSAAGSCSNPWQPAVLWQCFLKGSQICLAHKEASPQWHPVETIASPCFHGPAAILPEDLREPVPLSLISKSDSPNCDDIVELGFQSRSSHASHLTARCSACHPFFVRNKGYASCDTKVTREIYGLSSRLLEIGDICLPPSYSQQAQAAKNSEGSEVNFLEYSSAVALSKMAQKRSQEGSTCQQTSLMSPQQQSQAKRPMNAFLLWSQKMRSELIKKFPRTNNRDISSILSKEWHKMGESERRKFKTEARKKAELQRKKHPDCWKRKNARRDYH